MFNKFGIKMNLSSFHIKRLQNLNTYFMFFLLFYVRYELINPFKSKFYKIIEKNPYVFWPLCFLYTQVNEVNIIISFSS